MDDDVPKRLSAVESQLSDLRVQVSGIAAQMPHLATKADLGKLEAQMKADMGNLRSEIKEDIGSVRAEIGSVRAEIANQTTSLVKWMVGTYIAIAGLAFAIARFVH